MPDYIEYSDEIKQLLNPQECVEQSDIEKFLSLLKGRKILEIGTSFNNQHRYSNNKFWCFKEFPAIIDSSAVDFVIFNRYRNMIEYFKHRRQGYLLKDLIYVTDVDFTLTGTITKRVEEELMCQKTVRQREYNRLLQEIGEIDWYDQNIVENWR